MEKTQCVICLESNTDLSIKQKCCNNYFHHDCLKLWFHNNITCPLCREPRNYLLIVCPKISINGDYSLGKKFFTNNIEYLNNQSPQAWIEKLESKALIPLYSIPNPLKKEGTYISFYLRQIYLWEKFDPKYLKFKFDDRDELYLCTTQKFSNFPICYRTIYIMVEWIFELMMQLKKIYNFVYSMTMNSIILDLTIKTILDLKLDTIDYQTSIINSILNIIKTYQKNNKLSHTNEKLCNSDVKIDYEEFKKKLLWFTDYNTIIWNDRIDDYQQYVIDKNLLMILKI